MNALEHTSTTSKWATGAAIAAVVALAISALIAAMAMWVGGQGAMTRSWEGAAAAAAFFVAVGLSLCGFAAALNAKLSHNSDRGLWLAMAVFPVMVAVLVVVETGVIL